MTPSNPNDDSLRSSLHDHLDDEINTPLSQTDSVSPRQQRQLADEQLLHAMLMHHYSESEQSGSERVDRVLKAITPKPRKPLWFRLMRASLSSAAALILVVIVVELLLPQPSVAMSEFDRVVNAFLTEGDRSYSIDFAMQTQNDGDETQLQNRPSARRHFKRRGGPGRLNGATLYLRGGSQYVFEMKLPNGTSVWIGQNEETSWAVRPRRPVLVSNDRDAFRLPFFEEITTIPLLDVRDTLQAAKHGYELQGPKRVTLEDGRAADYFLARRQGQMGRRPMRIELWTDPHTGLLYRMVCSRMRFGGVVCRQMRMEYLNNNTLSANWFDYSGHSKSDVEIRRVTKEDIQRYRRQRRQERIKRIKAARRRFHRSFDSEGTHHRFHRNPDATPQPAPSPPD